MKLLLSLLLIAVALHYAYPKQCFVLRAKRDHSMFSISTVPAVSDERFERMLYGNGWADWRKQGEVGSKIHSFKGGFDSDVTVNVAMADGSDFKLKKLHYKAIHFGTNVYKGYKSDGSVVDYTNEKIKDQKRFPSWKKLVVKGQSKESINRLEIGIKLHDLDENAAKKIHKLYIRGLKVRVCQE